MLETYHPPRLGLGSRRALVGCALLVALLALPRSFGVPFVPKKPSKSFNSFGELSFMHKKQYHGSPAENNVSPG